jgi:hypothetical protein
MPTTIASPVIGFGFASEEPPLQISSVETFQLPEVEGFLDPKCAVIGVYEIVSTDGTRETSNHLTDFSYSASMHDVCVSIYHPLVHYERG